MTSREKRLEEQLKQALMLIGKLEGELSDSVSFFHTFDGYPESIGCACEAEDLESEDCICVDEDDNVKRVTDKEELLEETEMFLKEMNYDKYLSLQ